MLRVAQAVYDFFWDNFGVLVGTYRRNFFITVFSAYNAFPPTSLHIIIAIPLAALLWFLLIGVHRRSCEDDVDQKAGRYGAVNRRAEDCISNLPITLSFVFFVCAIFVYFWRDWFGVSFWGIAYGTFILNECLRVRERAPREKKQALAFGGAS